MHLSEHVISIKIMCTGPYKHVVKRNAVFILDTTYMYSKTCVKQLLSKRPKVGFQDQLSLNAGPGELSAILVTFIRLPFAIEIFVFLFLSGRFTQVLLYFKPSKQHIMFLVRPTF